MNTSFFLTRQTANLMEDFVRELASNSAFYLLYGSAGVGKTRLLTELKGRRLTDRKVVFVDLAEGVYPGDESFHQLIEGADDNAIVILDHFDQASNKSRHSVFREWSVDAIDKQLNFIVACRDDGFNEFRQLSQQYHVSVQSFQLLPFNQDEIQAFLAFYLFDNNPLANLSITAPLRKQLKKTNGVVGQVIELAEREKAGIREGDPSSTVREERKAGYLLAALIVCGAVGVGLWFLGNWSGHQAIELQVPLAETPEVVQPAPPENVALVEPGSESEPVAETVDSEVEPESEPEPVAETVDDEMKSESEPEPESVEIAEEVEVTEAGSDAGAKPVEPLGVTEEPAPVPDSGGQTESIEIAEDSPVENENQNSTASGQAATVNDSATQTANVEPAADSKPVSGSPEFEEALASSLSWIESNEGALGTIQIMSIGFNQFSTRNYFRYLDSLRDKGVDVSQIRVFRTRAGENEVYTIIYGQYADRRVAFRSIEGLPEELRANAPIPRTLAGILGEIDQINQ